MNWLKRFFGTNIQKTIMNSEKSTELKNGSSSANADRKTKEDGKNEPEKEISVFPYIMLGRVNMVIVNYEGQKDRDLQQSVVNHLMPLMRTGGGFVFYCNASISPLATGEPACALINVSGGFPAAGVSLDSYMAYIASKDSFPTQSPAYGREYSFEQIGYWIGKQNGTKVHAILLF